HFADRHAHLLRSKTLGEFGRNADDFHRRILGASFYHQPPADGIAMRPKTAGEVFTEDDDIRTGKLLFLRKSAARYQRDAHGAEIIPRHHDNLAHAPIFELFALRIDKPTAPAPGKGQRADRSCRQYPRNAADPFQQVLMETLECGLSRAPAFRGLPGCS